MKKTILVLSLLLSILSDNSVLAQTETPGTKLSVQDRLSKARSAKADKRAAKVVGTLSAPTSPSTISQANQPSTQPANSQGKSKVTIIPQKATPTDSKSLVDKSQHGPNGEMIYTGARGAKYYINKNGNKTYLSSNL